MISSAPSLYEAEHHIQPVVRKEKAPQSVADVVGPICESGDFLGKDRKLPVIERGEAIALLSAGSYGMVMSSNYNARPRPAEVLVSGNTFKVIRGRETFEHMVFDETDALIE